MQSESKNTHVDDFLNVIKNEMKSNNDADSQDHSFSMQRKDDYIRDYIIFDKVRKEYKTESIVTVALNDASFKIDEGELVVFLGQSGAGKTTAINLLGGIDSVSSGRILVGYEIITDYTLDELTEYRRNDIGFVFQSYNLVANLTAKENIELSTEICPNSLDPLLALEKVGLKGQEDKHPSQLSGGEQQRLAIARAIAKKPKLLLCDEPTGSLDYKTGKQILKLLQDTCRKEKITTIIITHNFSITPMADKIVHFNSGCVESVEVNENPIDVEELEW